MKRRIFLDVGANKGQTLAAVLDPALRFDEIFCFEPSRVFMSALKNLADKRVVILPFGLWYSNGEAPLFGSGTQGGSVWDRKNPLRPNTELCQFRRASEWFKENLSSDDVVFLKLNVEGSECDILDDLLDSGEFEKVSHVMIDFDVRKIESQKHREAELRERLSEFKFPRVAFSKQVMVGNSHQARIKNWLRLVEETR